MMYLRTIFGCLEAMCVLDKCLQGIGEGSGDNLCLQIWSQVQSQLRR